MRTPVGDLIEPVPELGIEVVEIAEAPAEEEVLPHIAERALHLALGLGPIRPTSTRLITIVFGKRAQGGVVDDVPALGVLAMEHGAHAVIQDLPRHPAKRLEGRDMAAQQGLHVLAQHEAAPHHPAVAEHQRE